MNAATVTKKYPRALVREREDGETFLAYKDRALKASPLGAVTLEELADFLDQDAESNNSHPFVGVHRALAVLLFQHFGRDAATDFMLRLSTFSGLHGAVDDAGAADGFPTVFQQSGISEPWHNWLLPDVARAAAKRKR